MLNKLNLTAYAKLMRIDKPVGILLLLWPTLIGLFIAANGMPPLNILLVFVIGTILMRSAGCIMNDIADMQYDGHVERTRHRPLVNGSVTKKEAYGLALVLSLIAFILVLSLNTLTIQLSFIAVFLAASYPLMKRFISIPQAYLGIAFGFGIPMSFAAINNNVPAVAWWLLLANVFWAIAYDTEYAMVDREDDLKIGIQSSAITFGRYDVFMIMMCYLATLLIMAYVGVLNDLFWQYFVGIAVAAIIAGYHYTLISSRNREACFKAFLHNIWFGLAIFIGLLMAVM